MGDAFGPPVSHCCALRGITIPGGGALLLTAPCSWWEGSSSKKLVKEGWSCCADQPLQLTA